MKDVLSPGLSRREFLNFGWVASLGVIGLWVANRLGIKLPSIRDNEVDRRREILLENKIEGERVVLGNLKTDDGEMKVSEIVGKQLWQLTIDAGVLGSIFWDETQRSEAMDTYRMRVMARANFSSGTPADYLLFDVSTGEVRKIFNFQNDEEAKNDKTGRVTFFVDLDDNRSDFRNYSNVFGGSMGWILFKSHWINNSIRERHRDRYLGSGLAIDLNEVLVGVRYDADEEGGFDPVASAAISAKDKNISYFVPMDDRYLGR